MTRSKFGMILHGIAPAEGWWAYSVDEQYEVTAVYRLACFALIEYEDGNKGVAGLDRFLHEDFAPETVGAELYVYVGPHASEEVAWQAARAQEAEGGEEAKP